MSRAIERFEDFVAWQRARELAAEVYRLTGEGAFARDFGLRDQMRRSAVSTMSNIAEGFERGRASEFHQFLSIAKGSCAELRSQLYVALDAGYLTMSAFEALSAQANEVARILGGLRASVERRRDGLSTHHSSLITHH
jgi:four helix bundle protein